MEKKCVYRTYTRLPRSTLKPPSLNLVLIKQRKAASASTLGGNKYNYCLRIAVRKERLS